LPTSNHYWQDPDKNRYQNAPTSATALVENESVLHEKEEWGGCFVVGECKKSLAIPQVEE
jgi:hypothetical protein